MKVGDLIRPRDKKHHQHIGIILEFGFRDMLVAWNDGDISWCYQNNMEVICK